MIKKGIGKYIEETIDFQDGGFFKELTGCIDTIRNNEENSKKLNDRDFYNSADIKLLVSCIKKYTNITCTFEDNGYLAAVMPLLIKNNDILLENDIKDIVGKFLTLDTLEKDLIDFSKNVGTKLKGTVNLKTSRVGGIFSELVSKYSLRRKFIFNNKFTPSEIAAILIHETGHVFTHYEYINRVNTTNQVLSAMTKAIDAGVRSGAREIIFTNIFTKNNVDSETIKAVNNAKTVEEITVIAMGQMAEASKSELGLNIYDYVSCEQLADQFAARHGCSKDMVIAMDKLAGDMGGVSVGSRYSEVCFIAALAALSISVPLSITVTTPLLALMLLSRDNKEKYDKGFTRILRLKQDNTDRLKNKDLSNEDKLFFTNANKNIDLIVTSYNESKSMLDTMAYYLRPSFRKVMDYEKLQKDLERFASNSLFDKAAKLSTL